MAARLGRQGVIIILAMAVVFGMAMSAIKGNGGGVRDAVGNVSAPWLLLPFIAGAIAGKRRVGRAAAVGCVASLAALASFYVGNAFVLDLGPHPWLHDLRLTVTGGEHYLVLGALSGPVFGALGGWWQRSESTVMGVLVAALLVIEPLAWLVEQSRHVPVDYFTYLVVWVPEVVVGGVACVVAATVARPARPDVRRSADRTR